MTTCNDPIDDPVRVQTLVDQYRPYAAKLAHQIAARVGTRACDDLLAHAERALFEAARRWLPSRGALFTTFAYPRIRGAVYDALAEMRGLGAARRRRLQRAQAEDALIDRGVAPADPAAAMEAHARRLASAVRGLGMIFLLSQMDAEGTAPEAIDDADPADQAAARELRGLIAELPPADRRIVLGIYYEGQSMAELGAELGVDKSTVCRRHARVLSALRERVVGALVGPV